MEEKGKQVGYLRTREEEKRKLPEFKEDGSINSCGDCYYWEPTSEEMLAPKGFCYKGSTPKEANRHYFCFGWRDYDER